MGAAKNGDKVKVHYTGKFDDGTIFDSSLETSPIEFTVGEGSIIAGFEEAVVGMSPGESKNTTIEADSAYGPHRKELVLKVERNKLPENMEPQVGQVLQIGRDQGNSIPVTVIDVSESTVTLDANHPLAGRDLTFEIELLEIT